MSRMFTMAVLSTFLFLVAAVDGQQSRRGRGRIPFGGRGISGDVAFLASFREVQDELGATSQQRELLESLQSDLTDQRRGMGRGRGGGPPGTRQGNTGPEQMRQRFQTLSRQGEKLVMAVLEPSQVERLRQLRLQWEGTRALERDAVVKSLGLSESQIEKIRGIRADRSSSPSGGETRSPTSQQRQAWRARSDTRVMAVLSDEQKQNWEKMKGKQFDLPDRLTRSDQRGFPGRGGRGGSGRGPGPSRP